MRYLQKVAEEKVILSKECKKRRDFFHKSAEYCDFCHMIAKNYSTFVRRSLKTRHFLSNSHDINAKFDKVS